MMPRRYVLLFAVLLCSISIFGDTASAVTFTQSVFTSRFVNVIGAVSKGSGTFVIDHPLDPKNKLLYHSFVESPDVKNIYDGIVMLDDGGEAVVELPEYFIALNKDFRYLVTPVGQPMPNLHISGEIKPHWFGLFGAITFRIVGGVPGGKVSWQVSGIRHDPFILAHPIVPEVAKSPKQVVDVGEYVCPECYENK